MTQPTTPSPLEIVGDANADACEGDACVVNAHPEHALVTRALDADAV
ncbi:hypothetical protein [uncultured Schumannella sp.]|jgi:hypothetical protein|nr:hypothetical protein [uncultured Schumannella sp.]